jgi:hypothetical protein
VGPVQIDLATAIAMNGLLVAGLWQWLRSRCKKRPPMMEKTAWASRRWRRFTGRAGLQHRIGLRPWPPLWTFNKTNFARIAGDSDAPGLLAVSLRKRGES